MTASVQENKSNYNNSTWHAIMNNARMSPWWNLCTLYLLHARWSYHRRLGSLLLYACSMCDINCLSAITSHCLLILQKRSKPHSVSEHFRMDPDFEEACFDSLRRLLL